MVHTRMSLPFYSLSAPHCRVPTKHTSRSVVSWVHVHQNISSNTQNPRLGHHISTPRKCPRVLLPGWQALRPNHVSNYMPHVGFTNELCITSCVYGPRSRWNRGFLNEPLPLSSHVFHPIAMTTSRASNSLRGRAITPLFPSPFIIPILSSAMECW